MKTIVVIPAFNEEKVIGGIIDELKKYHYHDIIVVDDSSDDDTADVAEKSGAIVLRHLINRGQGAALKTGIIYALQGGADIIVTFDADGQHQVADIEKLIKPILEGKAGVVLGSRFLNNASVNIPSFRKFILKLATIFTRITSKLNVTDTHNGLRAFSREAIKKIEIRQDRMAHASEILDEVHRNKLSYMEVPVVINYNEYSVSKGQSSMAFGKIILKYFLGKITK